MIFAYDFASSIMFGAQWDINSIVFYRVNLVIAQAKAGARFGDKAATLTLLAEFQSNERLRIKVNNDEKFATTKLNSQLKKNSIYFKVNPIYISRYSIPKTPIVGKCPSRFNRHEPLLTICSTPSNSKTIHSSHSKSFDGDRAQFCSTLRPGISFLRTSIWPWVGKHRLRMFMVLARMNRVHLNTILMGPLGLCMVGINLHL